MLNPGAVVEIPSGADSSGFCLSSEIAARLETAASEGEIIDTGPLELNVWRHPVKCCCGYYIRGRRMSEDGILWNIVLNQCSV